MIGISSTASAPTSRTLPTGPGDPPWYPASNPPKAGRAGYPAARPTIAPTRKATTAPALDCWPVLLTPRPEDPPSHKYRGTEQRLDARSEADGGDEDPERGTHGLVPLDDPAEDTHGDERDEQRHPHDHQRFDR